MYSAYKLNKQGNNIHNSVYFSNLSIVYYLTQHSRLKLQKIKSDTVSTVSPSICHEVMGLDAIIFVF